MIKSIVVMAGDEPVLAMVRGDQELQETKLAHLIGEHRPAKAEEILKATGAGAGSIGPVRLDIRKIADASLAEGVYTAGANKDGYHLSGVVPGEDFDAEFVDIRRVNAGEACLKCGEGISVERVIEIGNIFKLGTKYSEPLGASYLDENGKEKPVIMGSYGIGPARIAAAAVEQLADDKGIVWPASIAPFEVHLLILQPDDSEQAAVAEKIYSELMASGVDVLLDDRSVSPGVKFADAELLGCPLRITIGKRSLKDGQLEMQVRNGGEEHKAEIGSVASRAIELLEESI
jgi:prolyl-tRNA synthetase